jgi:hypothetical protein
MRKFVRRGREFWARLVEEFEREGGTESHAAFAKGHGVGLGSFQRWLYRLRAEQQGRRRRVVSQSTRVPWPLVEVRAARVMDGRFEIELPGGRQVRVPDSFDTEALRRLLTILDERPPA